MDVNKSDCSDRKMKYVEAFQQHEMEPIENSIEVFRMSCYDIGKDVMSQE